VIGADSAHEANEMTTPSIPLERARNDSLDRVRDLLAANDLPSADIRTGPGEFFVALDDGELVGVGGLELYGADGLLRSVVVEESSRGQGYGAELCRALERHARDNGVRTLYLLTTSAADFFRQQGYDPVSRADVPTVISETTQFEDLCPASATCLARPLD